jgi:hypothetical protein
MGNELDGLIRGLSITDYHEDKTAVSASRLKLLWKSPRHFKAGPRPIDPKAGLIGNAFEKLLLEPETFEDEYFILNDIGIKAEIGGARPTSTKAYKEWVQEQLNANEGKTQLSTDDWAMIFEMRNNCLQNDTVQELLTEGEVQTSIFYERNGIRLKTRPDFVRWNAFTLDVKTTGEIPTPANLQRVVWNYRYDVQAMLQVWGCEAIGKPVKRHFWLFVEKNPPYDVAVVAFDLDDMDFTTYQIDEKLELLTTCRESNSFPGVEIHSDNSKGIINLQLPAWAK